MISLKKQLLSITTLLVVIMFLCGVIISTSSNIHQINEQLSIKNNDNANLLAQVLSEVEKDTVLLELLVSAQFDTGHYEYIKLRSFDGSVNINKEFEGVTESSAPKWFSSLVNIDARNGVAYVDDGWSQFGTVEIRSHSQFLINELWKTTKAFAFWSAVIALVVGFASLMLLNVVTLPLYRVILQAEALGAKRFISLPVPKTLEYQRLVISMNRLTERVKAMLAKESEKLQELRFEVEHDKVTGALNRDVFLNNLTALLGSSDKSEEHGIMIVRITNLERLNKEYGRRKVDADLVEVVEILNKVKSENSSRFENCIIARLNGSDFALLVNHPTHFDLFAKDVVSELSKTALGIDVSANTIIAASALFKSANTRGEILMKVDSLISEIESSQTNVNFKHSEDSEPLLFLSTEEWRLALENSIKSDEVFFELFPVVTTNGNKTLHYEGMLRAKLQGEVRTAGLFMPWARKTGLLEQIEMTAISSFFSSPKPENTKVSIKVSYELLNKSENRRKLKDIIALNTGMEIALEIHENALLQHAASLEVYCSELQNAGYLIGIQSALNCFNQLTNIQRFGVDFVKLHASLTQGAHDSVSGQKILNQYCQLANSIGAVVIAQGFQPSHDKKLMADLGVEGVTGPGVNRN